MAHIIVFANDERTKSGNISNHVMQKDPNYTTTKSCSVQSVRLGICRPPGVIQRERKFYVHRMNGYACLFGSILCSVIETFSHELPYNLLR